ncbi:MAG: CIA30 family protein [Anaerolineae bacterium]|nr:CIA30 family protein [Anaerolineae bacterium]
MNGQGRFGVLCTIVLLLVALFALPASAQEGTRIIFLHHSCGANLIEEGSVREGLTDRGYAFFDHGYNGDGLRLADGSYSGINFDVPDDNTDPDGIATIFSQPLNDPPDNTFSHLMTYDVIIFKSCFPVSNIWGDELLAEYQSYYLSIRDRMDQYPGKVFIVVTQPPQVPGSSDDEEAARARELANWLQSDAFLSGHPNVFTFDFFGQLAGSDNFLRREYRYDNYDAHPNERANREIGPRFVDFVDQAIRSDAGGALPPEPPVEEPPVVEPPVAVGVVEDFESDGSWGAGSDEHSTAACAVDPGTAHSGAASLRIDYDVASDGWAECGGYYDQTRDWSGGEGLSLWLRADAPGHSATLMVFCGDPESPTPFDTDFVIEAEAGEWTAFTFPWSEFSRAEWADAAGLSELDPARITGYGLAVWTRADAAAGSVWLDDIGLFSGGAPPAGEEPEPVEEEPVEEESPVEEEGGRLCPLSAIALPLAALAAWGIQRRR